VSVRVERQGAVATVILDRPDRRNAVDRAHAEQLHDAFTGADRDESVSVVILHGAGGHFCAGADLRALGTGEGVEVTRDGPGPMGPTRLQMTKPVIAAVEGYAVAGGLELALWCDLRVVGEEAVFGVFCRRWGVPLIDGGTVRLPRVVGMGRALDMILTGRPVGAAEALSFGLATEVVSAGDARARAEQLAAAIARFPQGCLRSDRRSALDQHGMAVADALAAERCLGLAAATEEALPGAARFAAGEGRHGDFGAEPLAEEPTGSAAG
jgi:enoyl-CoA hydratase